MIMKMKLFTWDVKTWARHGPDISMIMKMKLFSKVIFSVPASFAEEKIEIGPKQIKGTSCFWKDFLNRTCFLS